MQHDSNDFVKYSGASRADMLAANISLSADVDISDTGLTGFMRDNGEDTFTGTLNGNSHKLTMTVGIENDKIVFHTHNGLCKDKRCKNKQLKLVSNLILSVTMLLAVMLVILVLYLYTTAELDYLQCDR